MIKIIDGDLFTTDAKFIVHAVNCQGVMGSGVALQVHQKYPHVYYQYKKYCMSAIDTSSLLGSVLSVPTGEPMPLWCAQQVICNIFTQINYGREKRHTDYQAFETALLAVKDLADDKLNQSNSIIAMPYMIGCDRGGGDWDIVYRMIDKIFAKNTVLLYRLNKDVK